MGKTYTEDSDEIRASETPPENTRPPAVGRGGGDPLRMGLLSLNSPSNTQGFICRAVTSPAPRLSHSRWVQHLPLQTRGSLSSGRRVGEGGGLFLPSACPHPATCSRGFTPGGVVTRGSQSTTSSDVSWKPRSGWILPQLPVFHRCPPPTREPWAVSLLPLPGEVAPLGPGLQGLGCDRGQ